MLLRKLVLLLAAAVFIGAIAGCGGGQQGGESQGSGSEQKDTAGNDKKSEKASGYLTKVFSDRDVFVINPKEGEPMAFKYRDEKLKVKLDDEQAGPEDIEKGQKATVKYIERTTPQDREVNVARSIKLQSTDGGEGGEETTG